VTEVRTQGATGKKTKAGLEVLLGQEIERTVREGRGHHGRSAVVQFIGRKAE
jgi:hypothetical protein